MIIKIFKKHLKGLLYINNVKSVDNDFLLICKRKYLLYNLYKLKNKNKFHYKFLIDILAIDYLYYSKTNLKPSYDSYSYAKTKKILNDKIINLRFAIVYNLLSIKYNSRLFIKVYLNKNDLIIPTISNIWGNASWHEREIYDLFGIVFKNNNDLRRILTDYGFYGHPLRKDFPLLGNYEVRYDNKNKSCIKESVSIKNRVNIPKIIRKDNRYLN